MNAEVVSIGTEIMLGSTLNTNTYYLTEELTHAGIDVIFHTSVGDDSRILKDIIEKSLERVDLLILTGGLGPTKDDITKEIVSEVLGLELELDESMLASIRERFDESKEAMPENNTKQAYKPKGSSFLKNELGTAPGIYIESEDKTIILLPGPPREMKFMFDNEVLPLIKQDFLIKTETINIMGIGESKLEMILNDLLEKRSNPIIATYAKEGQIDIKIVAKGENEEKIDRLLEETVKEINKSLEKYIVSNNGESVEEVLLRKLKERDMKVAFAESCTGGLISSGLTKLPGASDVFHSGLVTYSNESKVSELGVKEDSLEKYGAVSEEVALEMVEGLLSKTGVDIALSTTGIAGPGGSSKEKPLGLIYIGLASKDASFAIECKLKGGRNEVQRRASKKAFSELLKFIDKID